MATLLRCLVKGCTKLEIEVTGKNMGDTKGLINAGVAFGYLQKVDQDSNLINAMGILKQEGIEVFSHSINYSLVNWNDSWWLSLKACK